MTRALLIVDAQKGFCCAEASHLPPVLEDLQQRFDQVIATRFINPVPSPWRDIMDWHECSEDSDEAGFASTPAPHVRTLTKASYGVDPYKLRSMFKDDVSDIYICGADTHACVLMSAVAIFESHLYKPFVIADACASHSGVELHKAGLKSLEGLIGQQQIIKIKDL